MDVKSFEDLEVWKGSIDLADLVHETIERFPKHVLWGLGVQMGRSAVSVSSNIAEGCERQHTKEYIQFCYIALGSCAELYTQLQIAKRRNYITEADFEKIMLKAIHVRRMLKNMVKSLRMRSGNN